MTDQSIENVIKVPQTPAQATGKNTLTAEQWEELESYVYTHLHEIIPTTRKIFVGVMMNTYGMWFDLDALYRFYRWATENGQSESWIMANIMHDLNGRYQDPRIFSPRSSDY